MNLFKTTALALVLGAFGLAHSAAKDDGDAPQSSGRPVVTRQAIVDQLTVLVAPAKIAREKIVDIEKYLSGLEGITFSRPTNSVALVGSRNVDTILAGFKVTGFKVAAPTLVNEDDQDEQKSGSASGAEDEDEESADEQGKDTGHKSGTASGDEEDDAGEGEEEDNAQFLMDQLSGKTKAFFKGLGISMDLEQTAISDFVNAAVKKVAARFTELTSALDQANAELAAAKDLYAQSQTASATALDGLTAQLTAARSTISEQTANLQELDAELQAVSTKALILEDVAKALGTSTSETELLARIRTLLTPAVPAPVPADAPASVPVVTADAPVPAPVSVPVVAADAPVPAPVSVPVVTADAPVPAPVSVPVVTADAPVPAPVSVPVVAADTAVPAPVSTSSPAKPRQKVTKHKQHKDGAAAAKNDDAAAAE